MTKRTVVVAFLLLFTATFAFAHAGHVHGHMGTITMLHDDGSFMIQTTDNESLHVVVNDETTYARADDTPAKRADLAVNARVVVKLAKDGKTAVSVKIGK